MHEPIPQHVQESVYPMVVFVNPIKHKAKPNPRAEKKTEHKAEPNPRAEKKTEHKAEPDPQAEPKSEYRDGKKKRKYTKWTMRKEFAMPAQKDGNILHVQKSRTVYPEEYIGRYIGRTSFA